MLSTGMFDVDYVLYCRLSHFYIHLLGLSEDRPCAVIRDGIVLDSNERAAKRGVVAGMALAQARTILREEGVFRTLRNAEGEEEQKRWLDLCAEFTGVIEPEDRHSAYLDLSAHPNPFEVAQKFLKELEALTACEVRFGVGISKWLARLSADSDSGRLTPLDAEGLADMPVQLLTPVTLEHRERLRFLGYYSIGLVAELSISTLRGQFGDDGLRIQLAAKGQWRQPVQALYPPDSLSEKLIFDGASEDALVLDSALVSLAGRIGRRLLKGEQQASEVHLSLEMEDGSRRVLSRRFNKPVRCPRSCLSALRLLFGRVDFYKMVPEPSLPVRSSPTSPTEGRGMGLVRETSCGMNIAIQSIGVRLPHLERARCAQQSLLGNLTKAQTAVRAEDAVRQVRGVFGEKSIQLAGGMSLPRRVRVLREWKNATGWR